MSLAIVIFRISQRALLRLASAEPISKIAASVSKLFSAASNLRLASSKASPAFFQRSRASARAFSSERVFWARNKFFVFLSSLVFLHYIYEVFLFRITDEPGEK